MRNGGADFRYQPVVGPAERRTSNIERRTLNWRELRCSTFIRGSAVSHPGRRRGLAPLELVLSLFFLLVLMALIINFGTTAPWHIRGQIAARHAVWRTLSYRTGGAYPAPSNWSPPATMGLVPPRTLATVSNDMVEQTWSQGDLMQPALRGPMIVDPASGKQILMNDRQYFEMINRAVIGNANLTKALPLLANMRKANINPMQPVLDHLWRFEDMGFAYNNTWRIKGWYRIEADQVGDGNLMNLFMQYQMADMKIQQNSGIQALLVLDRDEEFPPWGMQSPDVYPTAGGCDASPQSVMTNIVMGNGGLISRIQGQNGGGKGGVPDRLARAFISLYNQQIQFYKSQNPPNQGKIQQLQQLIDQLNQFIGTLS
jgi:hypothetical protein